MTFEPITPVAGTTCDICIGSNASLVSVVNFAMDDRFI